MAALILVASPARGAERLPPNVSIPSFGPEKMVLTIDRQHTRTFAELEQALDSIEALLDDLHAMLPLTA